MGEFVKVGELDDFREGRGRAVRLDGVQVAVFRTGDQLVAFSDACPHMGASLADGKLAGPNVECAWHGWRYDTRTGQCDSKRWARIRVYEVKVEGSDVLLRRPDPPPPAADSDVDPWVPWDPDKHLKKKQ